MKQKKQVNVRKHQLRRTKIISSINENSNDFELLRQMIIAGANAFSVNMAYLKDRDELYKISLFRQELENEFGKKIPLNLILKGTIIRVGLLTEPQIHLSQGQTLYLTHDSSLIGNNQIISVECQEFFHQVKIGERISIDYGSLILEVVEFSDQYQVLCRINSPENKIIEENIEKYKSNKALVCVVKNMGYLRPYKPINIFQESENRKQSIDLIGEAQQITQQDLEDVEFAVKCNFDSITIANTIQSANILQIRQEIGHQYQHVQIFARIACKLKLETIEKIIREADGCIVARSYISMNSPVEDIVKYQSEIIELCRRLLKPVFIATQILESMLMSPKPSYAEMGDISNVVRQYIDGIFLSGETSFGKHPVEVVQTLDRICRNIERELVIETSQNEDHREHYLINYSGKPVASVIAQSSVEMAYILKAKAIIALTVTIGTTLKISKSRSPCQIIALTTAKSVCRCLNFINGVTSFWVEHFYEQERVIRDKINECLEQDLLQKGDYVVVLTGQEDEQSVWHINQMKVVMS